MAYLRNAVKIRPKNVLQEPTKEKNKTSVNVSLKKQKKYDNFEVIPSKCR